MAQIDVRDVIPGQTFKQALGLDREKIFLPAGQPVDDSDLEILDGWKIKQLELIEEDQLGAPQSAPWDRFAEEKDIFLETFDNIKRDVKKFFEDLRTRSTGQFGPVQRQARELIGLLKRNKELILVLANYKVRDTYNAVDAALDTAIFSLAMGMYLKLDEEKLVTLYECSILINIGQLRMEALLKKKEKLNPKEQQLIKSHPTIGFHLAKEKLRLPMTHCLVILTHHENIDGSGYPRGLMGDKIPIYAKISSVAQEFVALCEAKPYRDRMTLYQSMRTLISEGKKKFDQTLVSSLVANLSLYPIGSTVQLNDGIIALVVAANPKVPMRPFIKPILDANQKLVQDPEVIDLTQNQTLMIKKSIDNKALAKHILNYL